MTLRTNLSKRDLACYHTALQPLHIFSAALSLGKDTGMGLQTQLGKPFQTSISTGGGGGILRVGVCSTAGPVLSLCVPCLSWLRSCASLESGKWGGGVQSSVSEQNVDLTAHDGSIPHPGVLLALGPCFTCSYFHAREVRSPPLTIAYFLLHPQPVRTPGNTNRHTEPLSPPPPPTLRCMPGNAAHGARICNTDLALHFPHHRLPTDGGEKYVCSARVGPLSLCARCCCCPLVSPSADVLHMKSSPRE